MTEARFLNPSLPDLRLSFLFLACVIYAFFGSPTPDHAGWTEIIVGCLMVFSVGIPGLVFLLRFSRGRPFWYGIGQFFLIYGLVVGSCVSIFFGHPFSQALRDVIPFLFLFLPLFFQPAFMQRPELYRRLSFCFVLIGLVFSFRSVALQEGLLCPPFCPSELLYLENMPTVLFSALFLTGAAVQNFIRRSSLRSATVLVLFISLSLLPVTALILTSQRASLGAVALYLLFIGGFYLYQRPLRMVPVMFFVLAVLVSTVLFLPSSGESLAHKTALVGLNNRPEEAKAVWDAVAGNPLTLLFGLGWGAHFHSPAVGGVSVNFTHNFFTTMLLKCGLCGLIFSFLYIAGLARVLARVLFLDLVTGLALCAPFLIDITLYASFKSLDFGLTLLMICSSLLYFSQSESPSTLSPSSYASSDHTLHEPSLSPRSRCDGPGFARSG
ncbi:MAG: O-antigen ligase family protein [Alphaproteobacteria bacterium]|nr:O-antigen ligase family protein [Alphaproteobacteria bacterium]